MLDLISRPTNEVPTREVGTTIQDQLPPAPTTIDPTQIGSDKYKTVSDWCTEILSKFYAWRKDDE